MQLSGSFPKISSPTPGWVENFKSVHYIQWCLQTCSSLLTCHHCSRSTRCWLWFTERWRAKCAHFACGVVIKCCTSFCHTTLHRTMLLVCFFWCADSFHLLLHSLWSTLESTVGWNKFELSITVWGVGGTRAIMWFFPGYRLGQRFEGAGLIRGKIFKCDVITLKHKILGDGLPSSLGDGSRWDWTRH